MKLYELGTIALLIGLAALAVVGYVSHRFLGHDNEIEEKIEEVIKEKTGLDVDLSPSSAEIKVVEF